jgi:hypothetical protein
MSRKPRKTYFPKTRLSELVARPGGIPRDTAIEGAVAAIQELRGESDKMIMLLIGAIDDLVTGSKKGQMTEDDMIRVLKYADQIVTLSGTFGYQYLDVAVRSLCDVTDGLVRANLRDVAPIAVHVQSMRLLGPGTNALTPDQAGKVLNELAKILTHYKFGSLAVADDAVDEATTAVAG